MSLASPILGVKNGHLQPIQEQTELLLLSDGKGANTVIRYQPPDEPNVGGGFNLCPDGDQRPHFNATLSQIQSLCTAVAGTYLTERETWQLVRQRLVPKLAYALNGTSFTHKQCIQKTSASDQWLSHVYA